MAIRHRVALVERPVACAGRGQYIALVYYGSRGGDLHHRVLKYSYKDPRQKSETAVLRDISQMIPAHYRDMIVAISVVKKCLHPKTDRVPKSDRDPRFERVYSWVVEHGRTRCQEFPDAKRSHLEHILHGHQIGSVVLPYTQHELRELPVTHVLTTPYWDKTYASVGIRGVERTVDAASLA
jgi:hypothetical protein